MKNPANTTNEILNILKHKACAKQQIFTTTKEVFGEFKDILQEVAKDLQNKMSTVDDCIIIEYKDKGEFEAELKFAGDVLIFHMHSNVFDFDKSHNIWKSSYVTEENLNSFCGIINVYNFLADSIRFERQNDVGYMVARIFINQERHYFVEGKKQLGFLYNDFTKAVIDKKSIKSIINSAIIYSLDFDLLTPPYDHVREIQVAEMLQLSGQSHLRTGKRLGFRFQSDDDSIE